MYLKRAFQQSTYKVTNYIKKVLFKKVPKKVLFKKVLKKVLFKNVLKKYFYLVLVDLKKFFIKHKCEEKKSTFLKGTLFKKGSNFRS